MRWKKSLMGFGKRFIPWLMRNNITQPLKEKVETGIYTKDSEGLFFDS